MRRLAAALNGEIAVSCLSPMRKDRVKSSVIRAVGYDARSRELEVEFHSGRVYRYFEVPRSVYQHLLTADSVGKYFNDVVKPNHRGARLFRGGDGTAAERRESGGRRTSVAVDDPIGWMRAHIAARPRRPASRTIANASCATAPAISS